MLSPFRMVCRDFILPEDCKPCLFFSSFQFAKLIVPYLGFNYGYEKKKFDSRWKRLEVEYCDAGMSEEQIAAMKEYDWAWFCSQRVFQNHTQPIPCEQYDEVCGQSQLFRKFASLSYQWDVDKIDQTRYGWLASVENEQLLLRLKKLSKKDLELLTLLFVDGYGLTAPKKRNPKSSAKNPGDSANGKEKEIDEG